MPPYCCGEHAPTYATTKCHTCSYLRNYQVLQHVQALTPAPAVVEKLVQNAGAAHDGSQQAGYSIHSHVLFASAVMSPLRSLSCALCNVRHPSILSPTSLLLCAGLADKVGASRALQGWNRVQWSAHLSRTVPLSVASVLQGFFESCVPDRNRDPDPDPDPDRAQEKEHTQAQARDQAQEQEQERARGRALAGAVDVGDDGAEKGGQEEQKEEEKAAGATRPPATLDEGDDGEESDVEAGETVDWSAAGCVGEAFGAWVEGALGQGASVQSGQSKELARRVAGQRVGQVSAAKADAAAMCTLC